MKLYHGKSNSTFLASTNPLFIKHIIAHYFDIKFILLHFRKRVLSNCLLTIIDRNMSVRFSRSIETVKVLKRF